MCETHLALVINFLLKNEMKRIVFQSKYNRNNFLSFSEQKKFRLMTQNVKQWKEDKIPMIR